MPTASTHWIRNTAENLPLASLLRMFTSFSSTPLDFKLMHYPPSGYVLGMSEPVVFRVSGYASASHPPAPNVGNAPVSGPSGAGTLRRTKATLIYRKTGTPKPTTNTFDTMDAVHAKKLHALATRGSTEGERGAAQRKLDAFAGTFGMTGEEVVEKATKVSPGSFPSLRLVDLHWLGQYPR